jgi:N-acetylmuramoyl-L-alanine amidase
MLVKDIIGSCNTGLARGLSLQLIAKLNRMTKSPLLVKIDDPLIDTSSASVNPYLQPEAAAHLITAAKRRGSPIVINSCLRTTVQQHIIRSQYERGLCGITAAALPGRSNHERGAAIDIQDANDWEIDLEKQGWSKLGDFDPPHYDYWDSRKDIASLQISAFQALWNQYNPNNQIAVDGTYGKITAAKIDLSPIDGWS